MKSIYSVVLLLVLFSKTHALEMDEKLTMRLLNVSESKKTVLVNRGLEDGLVVGDHAKFFLTTGVVARGVVVKASPTRSIWSVYRLIHPDEIHRDKVMNIKISSAVKLTEDPTKSVHEVKEVLGTDTVGITLAPGAVPEKGSEKLSTTDQQEIASLGGESSESMHEVMDNSGLLNARSWEAWGLLNFSALSVTSNLDAAGEVSGSESNIAFSLGLEKYFEVENSFWRNISLYALYHQSSYSISSASGTELSATSTEYGAGFNYHFKDPFRYGTVIPYLGLSAGLGSSTDIYKNSASSANDSELSGSSNFVSLALGMKYYLGSGFGARALIDYYQRGESYDVTDDSGNTVTYTKTYSGPRFQMGLAYRF